MGCQDLLALLVLLVGVCLLGECRAAPSPSPQTSDEPDVPPPPSTGSPPESISNVTEVRSWTLNATGDTVILRSTNNKFSFNLLFTDDGKCSALVRYIPSNDPVWFANFNKPGIPTVENCTLQYTNNSLQLFGGGISIWSVPTSSQNCTLGLNDTGNLSLKCSSHELVWNSTDNLRDTIVTGQRLYVNEKLVSDNQEYSMTVDRKQVIITGPGRSRTSLTENLNIDISYVTLQNGVLFVAGNESKYNVSVIEKRYERNSLWEYAKLGSNGLLVVKSFADVRQVGSSNNGESYGVCSGNQQCACPSGFSPIESLSAFSCQRNANVALNMERCRKNFTVDTLVDVSGNSFSGFETNSAANVSDIKSCKDLCLKNCSCTMVLYRRNEASETGSCYMSLDGLVASPVDTPVPQTSLFLRIFNGTVPVDTPVSSTKNSRKTAASAFAGGAGAIAFVLLVGSAWFLYDSRRRLFAHADGGKFDLAAADLLSSRVPPQFTYQELVQSTGNFAQKLGYGGFSCVYAGHLPDNSKVAVKKLDDSEHKEKEFLAAVATIGSISHPNLVLLRGFCKEGQHRLLVYELVNEGRSLNWFLFPTQTSSPLLNAQTRRAIALGSARGLAHLHEDCSSNGVVHGGVKPENIMIDRKMHPKLVDFGLISLLTRDQRLSEATMRGSRGYMAPEWVKSQPITAKVDVYSLGIVILELVSGRRCLKQGASPEKCFLPTWAFSLLRRGEADPDCVLELADPQLDARNSPGMDQQVLKGMIYVALWCVQEEPSMRPPMKEVVRMLEGDATVEIPPISPALDAFAREMYAGYAGERAPESSNNSFMHSTSLSRNSDMRPR